MSAQVSGAGLTCMSQARGASGDTGQPTHQVIPVLLATPNMRLQQEHQPQQQHQPYHGMIAALNVDMTGSCAESDQPFGQQPRRNQLHWVAPEQLQQALSACCSGSKPSQSESWGFGDVCTDWGYNDNGYSLLPYFATETALMEPPPLPAEAPSKSTRFTWADVSDTEYGDAVWPTRQDFSQTYVAKPARQTQTVRNEGSKKHDSASQFRGSQEAQPCQTRGLQLLSLLETVPCWRPEEGNCLPGGLQPFSSLLADQRQWKSRMQLPSHAPKGASKGHSATEGKKSGAKGGRAADKRSRGSESHDEKKEQEDPSQGEEANSMKKQLQALQEEDPACVFIVRRINKLGFSSPPVLREHFSRFGPVKHVYVSHSRVKALRGTRQGDWRLRAAALGFVVMKHAESTELILASGPEVVVKGVTIRVFRFQSSTPPEVEDASGEPESEGFAGQEEEGQPRLFLEGVGSLPFADSGSFGGAILHAGQPTPNMVLCSNSMVGFSGHELAASQSFDPMH